MNTGTQWNQSTNSLPISHLHRNTNEIESPRTGSLQSILCYYQINYNLHGADIIVCNNHKPLAKFVNGKKMPITRSTDGDWNLQPTISHFNGY